MANAGRRPALHRATLNRCDRADAGHEWDRCTQQQHLRENHRAPVFQVMRKI
jgi:hypothetical protein